MASQSFNLIGQEEEPELVAFGTRQSRVPTPQSRPNSRMEEMLSQLIKSQAEANKSLEAKVSELAKSHTSTDYTLSHIAYKQIEQIAEMSDLLDRISTVERSLQGSPFTGSDPTRRSLTPPRHALMASAPYPPAFTTPSSLVLERSKTAKSSNLPPPTAVPLRRSLFLSTLITRRLADIFVQFLWFIAFNLQLI